VNEQQSFSPSRSYDITLKIKDVDYSNDLSNIRIGSSLATGYQIVTLTINITPSTILLNKIFGQDKILLKINLLDYSKDIIETMVFDLMIINSEFNLPISEPFISDEQTDRIPFDLITVTRIPFQIMTTMINSVFGINGGPATVWTGPKTPREMIETIVKEFTPKAILKYDKKNENTDKIMQCCIPPTTLFQAIKFLDSNYGLYSGAPSIFCQYNDFLYIMNLSTRIKEKYTLCIEHLTTSFKEENYASLDDKTKFFTFDNLNTNYTGNSRFAVLGGKLKYIVLPSDRLSKTITHDLNTICENYGIIATSKEDSTYTNPSISNRTKYYIENNGLDDSEFFAISKITKEISDVSRLGFSIANDMAIENLIKVGSCVKLKTRTMEYSGVQGNYILFSSDLIWARKQDWSTMCNIELIRTNKTV